MQLKPSAHTDTFSRDHLPPADQWPDLPLTLPELRYPDRLNCGAELLDGTIGRFGADRPAVISVSGDTWTYGDLRGRVDRIAHVLTDDLGVVPGARVLLRGPTGPDLAACWLAVMKAGAVAVTMLAQARPQELATVCAIAEIRHALCDVRTLDDLVKAEVPGLRITAFGGEAPDDLLGRAARKPERFEAVATSADDVAMIAFTSGTTGRPKGTMHFHRDVLAIADTFSAHVLQPRPDDVFAGSPPLGFTFGLGAVLIFPLRAGAATVLLEQAGPDKLLPAIARHGITVLATAPTAYRAMLGRMDGFDVSTLRRCVSAGENLPEATWRAWHERTGLKIINGIGSTEMLHIFIAAADDAVRPGTTGVPVPGYEARVVAPDGRPLPDGETGLLAVRGPTGCRYLSDPRQRDYVKGGWNLTGDSYIRDPDGYFRYVARADDMIITSGYNVAGPEVEDALLRHPDVVEAAVVGRPDPERGQIVVAYVVPAEGAELSEATGERLRDFVKAGLTPYKCPREIVFTGALPRTATGKLQRYRLRDLQAREAARGPAADAARDPARDPARDRARDPAGDPAGDPARDAGSDPAR